MSYNQYIPGFRGCQQNWTGIGRKNLHILPGTEGAFGWFVGKVPKNAGLNLTYFKKCTIVLDVRMEKSDAFDIK
jgi:hypothetical protein